MNYLNTKELSKKLHISRKTIQDLRESGLLPYIKLGKGYIYAEEDIDLFIKRYKGLNVNKIKSVRYELNA